jgi:hypothetical protein
MRDSVSQLRQESLSQVNDPRIVELALKLSF